METKIGSPIATVNIWTDDVKYQMTGVLGDPNSDILSISTNKDIRNPEGSFTIVFVPKILNDKNETWFDKLDVFDYVEICLQGIDDVSTGIKNEFIVMRGLIDSVAKSESWEGGVPRRQITISGRDLGALLTSLNVYFIEEIDPASSLLKTLIPLRANINVALPMKCTATDAVGFIMKQFKEAVQLRLGQQFPINIGDKIQYSARGMYPDDECFLFYLCNYDDNYWNALLKYEDKPFHEIFIYDAPDSSWVILRPSRLKDCLGQNSAQVISLFNGSYDQTYNTGVEANNQAWDSIYRDPLMPVNPNKLYPNEPYFSIKPIDKISVNLQKDGSQIYNYYITTPDFSFLAKSLCRSWLLGPYKSNPEECENPYFQTNENYPAFLGKFGFRKYEATTVFFDFDPGEAKNKGKQYESEFLAPAFMRKGVERNRSVVAWYLHNEKLLSGSMEIRGTCKAIIGTYLLDNDDDMEYYVEGVSHTFENFGSFRTSLKLERGMPRTGLGAGVNRYNFGADSVSAPVVIPKTPGKMGTVTTDIKGTSVIKGTGKYQNFNLDRYTISNIADQNMITEQHNPPEAVVNSLQDLDANVTQPLSKLLGHDPTITSAYRCDRTNALAGGVENSQHKTGQAEDLQDGGSSYATNKALFDTIKNSSITYDQLILENKGGGKYLVHISYKPSGNRMWSKE